MRSAFAVFLALGCCLSFRSGEPRPVPYRFPVLYAFPPMPVDPENPVTVQGVALGRRLFYDKRLSADGDLACASCHRQAQAFSDGTNAFSKGRSGEATRRNAPPLFNLAWYPRLFLDGRAGSLEELVSIPLLDRHEMAMDWPELCARIAADEDYPADYTAAFGDGRVDSARTVQAIAQFLRTLLSYRSKYDRAIAGKVRFTPQEAMGYELVNDQTKGDCLHCHTTDANALGTTLGFSNNGLPGGLESRSVDPGRAGVTGRASDVGKFKIPSLRNLAFTAPYMHDGRFANLQEVLDFYSTGVRAGPAVDARMEFAHQGGVQLSQDEKASILAFLLTLSDTAFIHDPAFSNPDTTGEGQ